MALTGGVNANILKRAKGSPPIAKNFLRLPNLDFDLSDIVAIIGSVIASHSLPNA